MLIIGNGVPAPSSGSECGLHYLSLSEGEVECGLSHHHVSGYLTVTSLAAKVRPSALSFGTMMVGTVPPVQVLSEKLSWEGNLSVSWLPPKNVMVAHKEATKESRGASWQFTGLNTVYGALLGFKNDLRLKLQK